MITDADLDDIERAHSGWRASGGAGEPSDTVLRLVRELRDARKRLAEFEQKKTMFRSDAGGFRPSGMNFRKL